MTSLLQACRAFAFQDDPVYPVAPSRKISIPGLGDVVAGPTRTTMIPVLEAFRSSGETESQPFWYEYEGHCVAAVRAKK